MYPLGFLTTQKAAFYDGNTRVLLVERPPEMARLNMGVMETIRFLLQNALVKKCRCTALVILSTENPFMSPRFIEDAARTLYLFNVDSVVSVRPETAMMYQHDGKGLRVILNQDRFTRLEREALFKHAGGMTAYRTSFLRRNMTASDTHSGHVVVDQDSALMIRSEYDLQLARFLAKTRILSTPELS